MVCTLIIRNQSRKLRNQSRQWPEQRQPLEVR